MEEITLIDGELIDTYGGDFTYRDVTYIEDDEGNFTFYEINYGAKPVSKFEVDDPSEIQDFIKMIYS